MRGTNSIPNNFLAQIGGKIGEGQLFFKVTKLENPIGLGRSHITFDSLSIGLNKFFLQFCPSAPPSTNSGIFEF